MTRNAVDDQQLHAGAVGKWRRATGASASQPSDRLIKLAATYGYDNASMQTKPVWYWPARRRIERVVVRSLRRIAGMPR